MNQNKKILIDLFNKTQIALNTMGYQGSASIDFMLTFLFWKYLSDTAKNDRQFNNPGTHAHFDSVNRNLSNNKIHEQIIASLNQWSKSNAFENLLELNFHGISNQFLPNIMHYWNRTFNDLPPNFWTKEHVDLSMEAMVEFLNNEYPEAHRMFAPESIAQLIVNALDTENATSVYDPFCRNGNMLMMLEDNINPESFIQGVTPDRLAWKFSKIHALMRHSRASIRMESINTLSNPGRQFDLIAANPPFNQIFESETNIPGSWSSEFASTKGTVRYITHCLDHLSDEGQLSMIVPIGFLSGAGHIGKLRERITRENLLEAVIELPSKVFYGTGVSAAIVFFSKRKKNKQTIFVNAADLGERQRDRTILTHENVSMLSEIIRSFKSKIDRKLPNKIAYTLNVDQILEKDSSWLFIEPAPLINRRLLSVVLTECRNMEISLRQIEEEIEQEMTFRS